MTLRQQIEALKLPMPTDHEAALNAKICNDGIWVVNAALTAAGVKWKGDANG